MTFYSVRLHKTFGPSEPVQYSGSTTGHSHSPVPGWDAKTYMGYPPSVFKFPNQLCTPPVGGGGGGGRRCHGREGQNFLSKQIPPWKRQSIQMIHPKC